MRLTTRFIFEDEEVLEEVFIERFTNRTKERENEEEGSKKVDIKDIEAQVRVWITGMQNYVIWFSLDNVNRVLTLSSTSLMAIEPPLQ